MARRAVSDRLAGSVGERAERVAVEVDDAVRQREVVAEAGERVGGVQGAGLVAGHA